MQSLVGSLGPPGVVPHRSVSMFTFCWALNPRRRRPEKRHLSFMNQKLLGIYIYNTTTQYSILQKLAPVQSYSSIQSKARKSSEWFLILQSWR